MKQRRKFVLVTISVNTCFSVSFFIILIDYYSKTLDSHALTGFFLYAFATVWAGLSSCVHLLTSLWLIGLLRCFKIVAILLDQQLQLSRQHFTEDGDQILKTFRHLETLTDEFNEVFGCLIAVDVLSVLLAILLMLFQMVVFLSTSDYVNGLAHCWFLTANIWIVVTFCEASYVFEKQTKRCSSRLKQLTPRSSVNHGIIMKITMQVTRNLCSPIIIMPRSLFRVNRRTLTDMASAIITYMVMLVQFYKEDETITLTD
ncbi:unnamed protein product [Orchesella dallaii]|uniref:Gustatory receptor n=1 Tax=Orchesella dallaii TaxID=48710 RepID=A0ABP1R349_9HEXA